MTQKKIKIELRENKISIPLLEKYKNKRTKIILFYGIVTKQKKSKKTETIEYGSHHIKTGEFIKELKTKDQSKTYKLDYCKHISRTLIGVANCSVKFHNAHLTEHHTFRNLRNQDRITRVIDSSLSKPLMVLDPGAGKSGATFLQTYNGKYILKRVKTEEITALIKLMKGSKRLPNLARYFSTNPESLLNKIYGAYTVSIGDKLFHYILMDDARQGLTQACAEQRSISLSYDLKGSSRAFSRNWDEDTSRSISSKTAKGSIKTGVNGDFSVIEGGKLPKALCDQYKTSIVKDTQFLDSYRLIDYSLLFTRCANGSTDHYALSLIDYLIPFDLKKKAESVIFQGKFKNYRKKINEFFAQACIP